jgi:hypothetical protein
MQSRTSPTTESPASAGHPVWYVGRSRIGGPPSRVVRWVYVVRYDDGTFSTRRIIRLGKPRPQLGELRP